MKQIFEVFIQATPHDIVPTNVHPKYTRYSVTKTILNNPSRRKSMALLGIRSETE